MNFIHGLAVAAAMALAISAVSAPAAPTSTPPGSMSPTVASQSLQHPAHALTETDLGAWLDGMMPLALGRGDIAGAEVVVVKDGHVLLEKGYGVTDMKY